MPQVLFRYLVHNVSILIIWIINIEKDVIDYEIKYMFLTENILKCNAEI